MVITALRQAVLYDPYPLWLDAVERVLAEVGTEVLAKSTSYPEAVETLRSTRPDVFITELGDETEDSGPFATVTGALALPDPPSVIVFSANEERDKIDGALEAGAVAYVTKSAYPDEFAVAVRQTFQHSIYLAPSTTRRNDKPSSGEVHVLPVPSTPTLTPRELEILELVAEGNSNAAMARRLWVTEQTVKFHLSNIYRKLDVSNRTEASHQAVVRGLLSQLRTPETSAR